MRIWETAPLATDNLIGQLEMLGGLVVIQGPVLQLSLLDLHFAFCWVEDLERWVRQRHAESPELSIIFIDASASSNEQAFWQIGSHQLGLEYTPVADADAAFALHRRLVEQEEALAGAGRNVERILISLRMSDSERVLVADYIL